MNSPTVLLMLKKQRLFKFYRYVVTFLFAQDQVIIRFRKGFFLYVSTWYVGKMLNYLNSFYPLQNLDIKSLKASLIALTTAPTVPTLASLKMADNYGYVLFTIYDLQKTSRPGHEVQQVNSLIELDQPWRLFMVVFSLE